MGVSVKIKDFYEAYLASVKKLYSSSAAKQNHLEPANQTSFLRTIARKAGISTTSIGDSYTEANIIAIINDTNSKYEEYKNGDDYSSNVRSKGKIRYEAFSDVLYMTLASLGLSSIADKLLYTKFAKKEQNDEQKTDVQVLEETLSRVGADDDKKVKALADNAVKNLKDAIDKVEKFIDMVVGVPTVEERNKIIKLLEALGSTIKDGSNIKDKEVSDIIATAKVVFHKADEVLNRNGMVKDESLKKLQEHFNGKEETTMSTKEAKQIQNIESMIPAVLDAIPEILARGNKARQELASATERNDSLLQEIEELKKKVTEAENSSKLPEGDDALFDLAKEAINKIEDKAKLKDLGMVIMMKAL